MRSQSLKSSHEETLSQFMKLKYIYEMYYIEGETLVSISSKIGVSLSTIWRNIHNFESENPEIAIQMKKRGKNVTSSDYDVLKKEIAKLKSELSKEKLRADFYEEMVGYGKEVYGIDLKKAGTK